MWDVMHLHRVISQKAIGFLHAINLNEIPFSILDQNSQQDSIALNWISISGLLDRQVEENATWSDCVGYVEKLERDARRDALASEMEIHVFLHFSLFEFFSRFVSFSPLSVL